MDMYKNFFACSDEEKLSVPHNYLKSTQNSAETYEHLVFRLSSFASCLRCLPQQSASSQARIGRDGFHFTKLGVGLEGIVNECLGLPPDFLANYTNDRSRNILMGLHYFPATEADNLGKPAHQDPGFFTLSTRMRSKAFRCTKMGSGFPLRLPKTN